MTERERPAYSGMRQRVR